MNISPEHRVLNEQERLLAASRLFGETLDRLDKFVPMQSTAAQTAMKKARRAAAALPEVARDTANAVKMGAAWHRREKTLKYAANTSGPVLADLTNSRVDRTKKEYGKKSRHEPYADSARVLRSGDADAQAYKMPFLKKGHFYSAETAVEIAVELKEREGQSVLRTATWLVQHKKVPCDETGVRNRVRKWYHDVEENLKLPETGGKRDLATKMAYSSQPRRSCAIIAVSMQHVHISMVLVIAHTSQKHVCIQLALNLETPTHGIIDHHVLGQYA